MIKFEDFTKLEMKIGTVVEAEKVEGSDNLLKTIIDFGDEKRQVVAGFGFKYSPEDILGKQVPVVLNIEPAEIRGVKSEGIFVALDAFGEPVLLLPEKPVKNGSILK
jgi:methionine--tRNA ligase beta chain